MNASVLYSQRAQVGAGMLKATLVYQWTHRSRGGLMQSRHLEKFQCFLAHSPHLAAAHTDLH